MIKQKFLNRRTFLVNVLHWGMKGILLSLLPSCASNRSAMASQKKNAVPEARQFGLKELSEKKLHHGNGQFINPFNESEHGGFGRLVRWKLFSKNRFKNQYDHDRVRPVHIDWQPIRKHDGCAITYLKHSSIMAKYGHLYLLMDPIFEGLFWLKDFSPLAFDIKDMPLPDHVLISHGHFDHLDPKSLSKLPKDTHVISPLGYDGVFEDLGMSNRTRLDWFDTYHDKDAEIICLPCNHWTMRKPIVGPNDSLWGAFLIRSATGPTIFLSGDTAYFNRFEEIGRLFAIDLAVFNLGAYEPRWFMANSHINPAETVRAFRELNARHLLIAHWGSFRLGDEPVHVPPIDMANEMEKQGMEDRLIHLDHGQTLFYDRSQIEVI